MRKTFTEVVWLEPISGVGNRTAFLRIIIIFTLGLWRLTFPEHMEEKLLGQNLESVQQEEVGGRSGQQSVRHQ